MKYVVISGSSGGMGIATTKLLVGLGYHVFGLDIKEPEIDIPNFTYIKTNVREISSIEHAYKKINKITNEIDAIINFAGIVDMNSLIEISEEDMMNIFSTNFLGTYRINKVFVPLLKEKGKVIITTSELATIYPLPFNGLYGISKSVLDKYAYSLRMELQLLNKQVVVIRPGAVKTKMIDISNERIDKFTENTSNYSQMATRFRDIINGIQSKTIPPEKIAKLVNKILNKKKPKYFYKINRNKLLLLYNILPRRFQNWVIKKILLPKKKQKTAL